MKCLFATNNPGKIHELKKMLQSESAEAFTLSDLGLVLVPEETGVTFEENALIKARETADLLRENGHEGFFVLADDSGLEIDAFGKKPGVDSANFLGADTPYEVRNAKILEMLADAPRTARFISVIACVFPDGRDCTTRGAVEGEIARAAAGENGFGYDPIFFLPTYGKTMAELPDDEKNKISHRGQALRAMVEKIKGEARENTRNKRHPRKHAGAGKNN